MCMPDIHGSRIELHAPSAYLFMSCSSPSRQKSLDRVTPTKPPQRPPPPKLFKGSESGTMSSASTQKISGDTDHSSSKKPKPPIRTRKKKFITDEELMQNSRQSEFVELSTSDIVIEHENQGEEVRLVEDVNSKIQEPKLDTLTEDKVLEEKEEAAGTETQDDVGAVREIDLDRDDWEVIPDSATNSVGSEDSPHVVMDEPCLQPNGYVC